MTAHTITKPRSDGVTRNALAFAKGDTLSSPAYIYVGTAGVVIATTEAGQVDVAMKIPAGGRTPCRVASVKNDAGTTAADMLVVW